MQRYEKYKDSGVKWIGEIPEHWSIIRHKFAFDNLDYLREPISADKRERNNPQYDYYGASGVIDKIDHYNVDDKVLLIGEDGANLVYRNLPLIYKAEGKFWVNNHAHILKPKTGIDYDYMFYTLDAGDYFELITGTAQPKLSQENLGKMFYPLPPLPEQQAIVAFLDAKTEKIDQYIAGKEKEIERLQELKQVEIANAVTHGLNPNAKMKPSGIAWIGDIPEEWEVSSMRSLFKLSKEKTSEDNQGTLLSLSQYTGVKPKAEVEKTGMFEAESTIGYNVVRKGQFVMNIMLAWNGSYAVSDFDGIISPSYCVFDFIRDCDKKYFDYLLRLKAYSGAFKTMSKGLIDSRLRLYPDYFKTFPVIIPPLSEQQAIVAHIERKLERIDGLAEALRKEIGELKELKQRIVSDAVTGKVRCW